VFGYKKLNPNPFSFARPAVHTKKQNKPIQQLFFDFTAGYMLSCSSCDE